MRALPSSRAMSPCLTRLNLSLELRRFFSTPMNSVLSFVLEPGQSLATNSQTAWSLYVLNAFTLELGDLVAEPRQLSFDAGLLGYWGVCRPLAGINLSDTVARFLIFEIKAS